MENELERGKTESRESSYDAGTAVDKVWVRW